MTLRGLFRSWNEFFYKPQSPSPVCLFRIFYGVIILADLLMLRPEWLMWYGPHAFTTLNTTHFLFRGPSMSLFELLPQTDLAINTFFWVFLFCTVCLTVGFMTRFTAVAVYLCLGSIEMRNGFILNSGDTLMLVCGFFLMFAPSGALFSVDHWLRVRRGRVDAGVPLCSPWAQRMLQIQTAVVYFATFYWKTLGILWINGTAVYYALRLDDFHRFPLPPLHNLFLIKTLTWSTLAIEFALGVLIWFKETRYPVLLAGICLHIGIEYAMNIPLFEWMIVATYINFVEPEDLSRSWNWFRRQSTKWVGKFAHVLAAGQAQQTVSTAVNIRDEHV
ncbi:MAG TPA: HTTM domain-containing protein [Verrucomicrobiae bacterium]|nr:HTTM domain-containing protein [Verrucomicrobiae bacterium]